MVICLGRGADLHMTQLMPLPLTVSCFSKIQIGAGTSWLHLQDNTNYFPKFKKVTWPWPRPVWHGGATVGSRTLDREVTGSIRYPVGARLRNDSGQVVHTHLPRRRQSSLLYGVVKTGYLPTYLWPRPFQGQFVVRRLELDMINTYIKFEVSMFTDYTKIWKATQNAEIGVV